MQILITLLLAVMMMAGLFLLLWGGVGFVQNKSFFSSAPKEVRDSVPDTKPERFKGQHFVGWIMIVLAFALMVGAVVIGAVLGVLLGVISALKKYTWVDSLVLVVSMFFQSVPEFVVALVLIMIFAVNLHLLPATGITSAKGFILPMLCIGLSSVASYTRITRSSMLEVLGEDYIRTARAKGQTENNITYHHALRNAMIPVAQSIGTSLGNSIGGGMVIETVFGVPGVGKYIVDSITQRNYPSVLGGALIIAIVLTLINLIVDISFVLIDPRLKTTIIASGAKKPKAKAA